MESTQELDPQLPCQEGPSPMRKTQHRRSPGLAIGALLLGGAVIAPLASPLSSAQAAVTVKPQALCANPAAGEFGTKSPSDLKLDAAAVQDAIAFFNTR